MFNERIVKTLNSVKENKDKVCPRCNQKLKVFNYAYDSNVFLDKCPHCQGMWADEGEAKKLARYLKEDPRITSIAKSFIKKDRAMQDSQDLAKISRTLTRSANPVVLSIPKMIIPLSDDTPRQRVPLVTIFIMILCVLIFIGQVFFIRDPFAFVQKFGLIPAHFLGIGLISSMFLHGGLLHLIGNMFFLWLFVSNVEDRFSRFGFLVFYLCCGLSANILHSFLNWNLSIPTMGASGAISGIMGAYFIFYPKARINIFVIYKILRVPAFLYLGVWVLFQLMFGFTFKTTGVSNIAWFAHIGGFIFGGLFAYFKKKAVIIKG
ncbi:MAG: rhomboid family intramembrane serine protease [bacterium]|nr:rhomboid family intramembrane serine protease [bacterium]